MDQHPQPYVKPAHPSAGLPQAIKASAFPLGLCASTTVEINVPTATQNRKFPFQINETLRNRHLVGAEVIAQLNSSRSPISANLITTRAQMDTSWLTLSLGSGYQQFERVWVPSLLRSANSGLIFPLNIRNVDWQDSFVYYSGTNPATAFASNDWSYVFTFYHLGDEVMPRGAY